MPTIPSAENKIIAEDAILLKAQFCAFNFRTAGTQIIKSEMSAGVHLWGKPATATAGNAPEN